MIMIVLLLAVGEIGFDLEIVTDTAVVLFILISIKYSLFI